VKPQAGGHVKLQIGMVHPVQPPQAWHRVEQYMLKVDRQIQQHD